MAAELGGSGYKADINVAPLVDVVLVLLIIFMVVTPLMQAGKGVEMPEAKHVVEGKGDREMLQVVITGDLELFVDNKPVDEDGLIPRIRHRLSFNPGMEVVVKGDKKLPYGKVREVMISCREAGAKRVVLAAKERKREEG